MTEWLPIESAPKDDELRVLLSDGKKVSIGAFTHDCTPQPYSDESELAYEYGDVYHDTWAPTHWQPLPTPPK